MKKCNVVILSLALLIPSCAVAQERSTLRLGMPTGPLRTDGPSKVYRAEDVREAGRLADGLSKPGSGVEEVSIRLSDGSVVLKRDSKIQPPVETSVFRLLGTHTLAVLTGITIGYFMPKIK